MPVAPPPPLLLLPPLLLPAAAMSTKDMVATTAASRTAATMLMTATTAAAAVLTVWTSCRMSFLTVVVAGAMKALLLWARAAAAAVWVPAVAVAWAPAPAMTVARTPATAATARTLWVTLMKALAETLAAKWRPAAETTESTAVGRPAARAAGQMRSGTAMAAWTMAAMTCKTRGSSPLPLQQKASHANGRAADMPLPYPSRLHHRHRRRPAAAKHQVCRAASRTVWLPRSDGATPFLLPLTRCPLLCASCRLERFVRLEIRGSWGKDETLDICTSRRSCVDAFKNGNFGP
ncbi:unnamed protein product [Phaeothamnion confervicola]